MTDRTCSECGHPLSPPDVVPDAARSKMDKGTLSAMLTSSTGLYWWCTNAECWIISTRVEP